ncbi:transposase [Salmonella enterica subsp. enterica serovar Molade]|nr:transposase [Salmonella enterica subsp. enterica serovar Molade]
MSGKCYLEAFKIKAVKQIIERGHSVSSIATRLDITIYSLYTWIKPPYSRRHHVDLNLTGHTGSSGWNRAVFMVIARDLSRSAGYREQCGVNKAWWLMQRVEIKAQVGYRSPRARGDSFY